MKYPQSLSMPSAVSDWLEEQLEARGIDAVLYTRYILSLLHTHTLDVIYPEDDLQFSRLRKEARRSSGCSKKVRRWRHAQADAEQLKRSAAVECLMSASDQNCEIESLVDELCEKLKEINNTAPSDNTITAQEPPLTALTKKISPQELAEKYYAAFPPLCPENNNNSNDFLTNFIPQWIAQGASPKKNKKKRKSDVMKAKANQSFRQRFSFNKKEPTSANYRHFSNKDMLEAYDMNNWEFFTEDNYPTQNEDSYKVITRMHKEEDQIVAQDETAIENEEDTMFYENLPLDISDLLSDSPRKATADILQNNNTGKQYNFIPCGTNVFSSIWSNDDETSVNLYPGVKSERVHNNAEESWPDFGNSSSSVSSVLQKTFSSSLTTVDDNSASSPSFERSMSTSSIIPGLQNDAVCESFHNNEQLFDEVTVSYMKINHCKERSGFAEVAPRKGVGKNTNKLPSVIGSGSGSVGSSSSAFFGSMFGFNKRNVTSEIEDLLTSEKSHFKPINEKIHKEYENGATFVISNNIDKVDYKRSESGTLYLENESGQKKKYREYRDKETSEDPDFILKFCVRQNDMACQTDTDNENEVSHASDCNRISNQSELSHKNKCKKQEEDELDFDQIEEEFRNNVIGRAESVMCEIATWKYDPQYCEKCNNNDVWKKKNDDGNAGRDAAWDNNGFLRNIWDGKEVCHSCLRLNGGHAPTPQNSLLREDISQDGEQLLSDLSSIQKTYMESLPPPLFASYPKRQSNVISMDTDDDNSCYVVPNDEDVTATSLWSFASRLEEDCLGAITSLPTLRSVTL